MGAALGLAVGAKAATGPTLTNPRGLRRFKAALDGALFAPAYIHVYGDSIADGVGATGSGTQNTDNVLADQRGWAGQLRATFAARLGTTSAGFIAPRNGSTADTGSNANPEARVVRSGGASISTTGPMWAGYSIGTGATLAFSVPRCTAFDILIYRSASNPTTGNFTYAVDGGAAVPVTGTGSDGFVVISVSGLSDAAHTIVLTGTQASPAYIFGVRYHSGNGVCVGRFARAGWTLLDSYGLGSNANSSANPAALARLAASYGAWSPHLTIQGFLHNDWAGQLTANPSGIYSTPANYQTYLQDSANRTVAAGGCMLLLAPQEPPTQTVPGGQPLSAYRAAMKAVALSTDHVAFLDINDRVGSVAEALAASFYFDSTTVHPSVRGGGMEAAAIFNGVTRPDIVGAA